MAFGKWLIDWLEEREIDQATLARHVNVGTGTVSRWANDHAKPNALNALDIARALRLPPADVLYAIAGENRAFEGSIPNLPPHLTRGESRLVEHLAWAVRHWREEQNAARDGQEAEAGGE